jgi:hypothetical protein
MFGWQEKSATTNGVFRPKYPQINIVKKWHFSYIIQHSGGEQFFTGGKELLWRLFRIQPKKKTRILTHR